MFSHTFVIAEIGINHNGSIDIAKQLIDVAVDAGCDAVKFQKRTPELHVKPGEEDKLRESPWGIMTTMEYRKRIEFSRADYLLLKDYAEGRGLFFTASPWDIESVHFLN